MGNLIERTIKTLFHGVSRQPTPVRLPGQVDDAVNVTFSVETGGFSKRYGSRHITEIADLAADEDAFLHTINRDSEEKYVVVIREGALQVFTLAGEERTVNVADSSASDYIDTDPRNLRLVTVADHTFVLNRAKVVAMADDPAGPDQQNLAVVYIKSNESGYWADWRLTVDGYNGTMSYTEIQRNTLMIAEGLRASLAAALPSGYSVVREGSYIYIKKDDGSAFTISYSDPMGDANIEITHLKVRKTSELPARAFNGQIVRIVSDSTEKGDYWVRFETYDGGDTGLGQWRETIEPGHKMSFDATTMPHALVREADGTFTLRAFEWEQRKVGTELSVPDPDFVGRSISDIVLFRKRLGLLADESAFFSRDQEYFNFFPEKSIDVLDTDPFGVTASTNKVSVLRYAQPVHKVLFATADEAQFEVTGELFTPGKASIDLTTNYVVSAQCRPEALGNSLYLAAREGDNAVLLEYVIDQDSFTNVAADVLKHAKGFVPAPLIRMVGDPNSGTLFSLTESDRSTIYTYTVFYNGTEKVQSAWGRWTLDGYFHDVAFLEGYLFALIRRGTKTYLEKITVGVQDYDGWRFVPRLDREVRVDGTYDPETDLTTWELPYEAEGVVAVTGWNFTEEYHRLRGLTITTDENSATAMGDWSEGETVFGFLFQSRVDLSKIYERDEGGMAVISGRLQLKRMVIAYTDTGAFEVVVTPKMRASRTYAYSANVIGTAIPGMQTISSGLFKARPSSRGDETSISISNNTVLPSTITSIAWTGFFNETSRQE